MLVTLAVDYRCERGCCWCKMLMFGCSDCYCILTVGFIYLRVDHSGLQYEVEWWLIVHSWSCLLLISCHVDCCGILVVAVGYYYMIMIIVELLCYVIAWSVMLYDCMYMSMFVGVSSVKNGSSMMMLVYICMNVVDICNVCKHVFKLMMMWVHTFLYVP